MFYLNNTNDANTKTRINKDGWGYFGFRVIRMAIVVYILFSVFFSLTKVTSESVNYPAHFFGNGWGLRDECGVRNHSCHP